MAQQLIHKWLSWPCSGDTADSWGQWPRHSTSANLSPFARDKKERRQKRKGYCLMSLTIQHRPFRITSPPESEDELKVTKFKSISGFLAKCRKPTEFLYWRILLRLWTRSLHSPELPDLSHSSAFGRGDATEAKQHRPYPSVCLGVHTQPISLIAKKFHLHSEFIFPHVFSFFFPVSSVQESHILW